MKIDFERKKNVEEEMLLKNSKLMCAYVDSHNSFKQIRLISCARSIAVSISQDTTISMRLFKYSNNSYNKHEHNVSTCFTRKILAKFLVEKTFFRYFNI